MKIRTITPMTAWRRRSAQVSILAMAVTGLALTGTQAAQAVTGCQVTYSVSSSWPGGFGANVTVHNLGDSVKEWEVAWSFPAGQSITQLWNGAYSQSGSRVSVANTAYNAGLSTGGTASFGFNGAWTGSNPSPTSFSLNGTACTGGVALPPETTEPPPPTTAPPTTEPPVTTAPPVTTTTPPVTTTTPPVTTTPPATTAGTTKRLILATFKGDALADEELWIYQSTNGGTSFSVLHDTNFRGPTGVLRDPSIISHNGRYYIAFTVGSYNQDSSYFSIASSPDLRSWTNIATVPSGIPNTKYTWAPEFFIDNGTVSIITSIRQNGCDACFAPHVYTAQNDALTSWSGPRRMNGITGNHIDTYVARSGNTWHAFAKDENAKRIEHWTSTTGLTEGWTNQGVLWNIKYEGPSLVRLDNGSWRMYVDSYPRGGEWTATSTDLNRWTGTSLVGCPGCRHGTAIAE